MLPTFSWLQEIVVTTKLWVVPTITRFFEAVYPQKSPQSFFILLLLRHVDQNAMNRKLVCTILRFMREWFLWIERAFIRQS